ncbi:phosphotransferase [Bacillus ndiopicus]|uniref:phosphotransferase n=1 Tax=Bacillus ndiopicus TaxID=1347368 RepID=UPI0009DD4A65|nr:phosphotransferase [Bacillus ndiopicus]
MMDFLTKLMEEYGIASIIHSEKLTKGQSATTYLIKTETQRKYIVKTIKSASKAQFEYDLLTHIRRTEPSIVAEILRTTSNKPFIQIEESIYQVQLYIESHQQPIPLYKLLTAYQGLQKSMQYFQTDHINENRFLLAKLWNQNKQLLKQYYPHIFQAFNTNIDSFIQLDEQKDAWIHGDLGRWNVLCQLNGQALFIDFSEARQGTKYFDLVALFTSYLPEDEILQNYVDEFFTLYEGEIDFPMFSRTIGLWYLKGILMLVQKDAQAMKQAIDYFYHKAQQLDKLLQALCNSECVRKDQ